MLTIMILAVSPLALAVFVLLARPTKPQLALTQFPNPLWLYLQVVVCLFTKGKTLGKEPKPLPHRIQVQQIQVEVVQPTRFDPVRYADFLRLVGGASSLEIPLSYPIVECFRIHIQAMLLPQFPFNVLGSVLARNTVTLLRPLQLSDRLVYRCEVDPAVRVTAKGDIEVDLVASAAAADDSQPAWRSTLTVIILSARRRQQAPRSGGAAVAGMDAAPAPAASLQPVREVLDVWRLASDTGRRYGLINGDLNPIHLYPATSRLFGFKRPIAHALCLVARAEASLRKAGVPMVYPAVLQAEFKRPTLLPATLQLAWTPTAAASVGGNGTGGSGGDRAAALGAAARSEAGLSFAVLTEDGSKEVLVGRLSTLGGGRSSL